MDIKVIIPLGWLSKDGKLIIVARIVRAFAYGFLSVVLAIYLKLIGFNDPFIGLILTSTLLNSVVFTLVASFYADRIGRRKMLLAYSQNSSSSAASSPILSKNSQSGSLTSLQNDATTGKTNWIIGGVYKMNNINTANPMCNATFYMMKTDGTAPHKHTVSDFKISGKPVIANNSTTFNGTSTVTMKEGPVKDVPTSIKFTDGSAVSLWFDPSKTKSHFGNTVIYGTQHLICKEMPNYCQ